MNTAEVNPTSRIKNYGLNPEGYSETSVLKDSKGQWVKPHCLLLEFKDICLVMTEVKLGRKWL